MHESTPIAANPISSSNNVQVLATEIPNLDINIDLNGVANNLLNNAAAARYGQQQNGPI